MKKKMPTAIEVIQLGDLVKFPSWHGENKSSIGLVVKVPERGNHVGIMIPGTWKQKMMLYMTIEIISRGCVLSAYRCKIKRKLYEWAEINSKSILDWRLRISRHRLIVKVISENDSEWERIVFKINDEDDIVELSSSNPDEEKK